MKYKFYLYQIGRESAKLKTEDGEAGRLILGDTEVAANLYCNFTFMYWEGCKICSIYLR